MTHGGRSGPPTLHPPEDENSLVQYQRIVSTAPAMFFHQKEADEIRRQNTQVLGALHVYVCRMLD